MVEGDTTVVIVTHNEQLIRELCTRVICLNDGELMVDTKDIEEGICQYHQSSNQKMSHRISWLGVIHYVKLPFRSRLK